MIYEYIQLNRNQHMVKQSGFKYYCWTLGYYTEYIR